MTWNPPPGWLFCPADQPDRYMKALDRADVVVLDLEDAVAPDRKAAARAAVTTLVREGAYDFDRTVLRVTDASSATHDLDLEVLDQTDIRRVMLAKAESPDDLKRLRSREIVALIETPRGVDRCESIADAPQVVGLMWGADDLVAGLGGTSSRRADSRYRDLPRYARSRVLIAAKAREVMAIDAVYMDIPDIDGLREECEDAAAVGFDATVAIHPNQVPTIRKAYAPAPERLGWAQRLLAAVGPDRGVTTFEGRMVDGPIYAQAEQVLRRAGLA